MNIGLSIFLFISINILWQIGGQCWKAGRRFLIPIVAILTSLAVDFKDNKSTKKKLSRLFYLLAIGILSMGYGESSWLNKVCKGSDTAVRAVYAAFLSLPFLGMALVNGSSLWAYMGVLGLLQVAFQVRAGVLFKWGPNKKYDWLIEDTYRASAFAIGSIILIFI